MIAPLIEDPLIEDPLIEGKRAMLDLIVRGATLPDGRTGLDIAIQAGRIVELRPAIDAPAHRTIDATGLLVTAPFVDPHFHLDATLALGTGGRRNETGTLAEGIRLWDSIRPSITADDYHRRAMQYCDLAVSHGLLAIRSHVDITDPALTAVEVLLDVKRTVAPYLDLQLVAFPQMGYFAAPETPANLKRALDLGVDIVGGAPHLEPTMALGRESVTALLSIAAERGLMADLHCDETDDPLSRHIEQLAYETKRLGLHGRAAGSHLTSMHSMDNFYAARLMSAMASSGVTIIANPLANMMLQGRFDTYPKRRGLTRIPELLAAGCLVATGHDSVLDPWYPLGRADMLDVAAMTVHAAHMSSLEAMADCFRMITDLPAEIMGLEGYGLAVGNPADLVILQAADAIEAIRLRPARLAVIRRGVVIAETPRVETRLALPGRPATLDSALVRGGAP